MKRKAMLRRKTNETDISLSLTIDGKGTCQSEISYGFMKHMFDLFARHGMFDLVISASGDSYIDEHHIIEDCGIVLGTAFGKALGDKKGISRYGYFILPMDECLATVAIDFSGRYAFQFDCPFLRDSVGDISTDIIKHFWDAFAQNARVNLYIKVERGENEHHKVEAIFKAVARAIRMASAIDPKTKGIIPSTKGVL
jgi:imidazoleglycerol-phosphate dehydratase